MDLERARFALLDRLAGLMAMLDDTDAWFTSVWKGRPKIADDADAMECGLEDALRSSMPSEADRAEVRDLIDDIVIRPILLTMDLSQPPAQAVEPLEMLGMRMAARELLEGPAALPLREAFAVCVLAIAERMGTVVVDRPRSGVDFNFSNGLRSNSDGSIIDRRTGTIVWSD